MQRKSQRIRKKNGGSHQPPLKKLSVATQGAAALALGLGLVAPGPAEASIVYTDIPDVTIQNNQFFGFDITNGTSLPQFVFLHGNLGGMSGGVGLGGLFGYGNPGAFMGTYKYVLTYPYPSYIPVISLLPKATQIPDVNKEFFYTGMFAGSYYGEEVTEWDGKKGYAGLIFTQDDGSRYGWVELSMPLDRSSLTIYGFAYETQVDTPIAAGSVPVPSSLLLMASGALGVLAYRGRRRKKEQPDA